MTEAAGKTGPVTILVVEDETAVRQFACATLRTEGYTVLDGGEGRTAEKAAGRFGVPPDLLITDFVMPEVDGPELARRLRPRFPDMKVLYISGRVEDEVVQKGLMDEAFRKGAAFLQKPFRQEELLRKVRAILLTPQDPRI
jgi:two-component system cell cycle sensor histidine kinase/response regulator CckA